MKAGDKVQVEVEKEIGFGLYNKFKHDAEVVYVGDEFVTVKMDNGQRRQFHKCKVHLVESESIEERLKKAEQKIKELEREAKLKECLDGIRCSDWISVRQNEIPAIDLLNKKIDELEYQEKTNYVHLEMILKALEKAELYLRYSSTIGYNLYKLTSDARLAKDIIELINKKR